jgi:hypothetical protein
MTSELFADNAVTSLASSPSAGATSFTVAASGGFPAAVTGVSQFRVIIDTEIVTVTNVSGTTWTCVALAAGHATAVPVTHVITAAGLGNHVDSKIAAEHTTERAYQSSMYAPLVERYAGKNLYLYGNSYVQGSGASDLAHSFAELTAAALGMTEVNRGAGSEQTYETLNRAIHDDGGSTFITPSDAGAVVICSTLNEVRAYGLNGATTTWEAHAMNALVETILASTRSEEANFTFTGGGWSASTSDSAQAISGYRLSGGSAKYTTTNTDYYEASFSGETVVVHSFSQPATSSVTVEYKIDGAVVRTVTYTVGSLPGGAGDYPRIAERLTGLPPGSHTLRVTKTGGANGLWADFIDAPTPFSIPIVIVPGLYLTTAGYAADAPLNYGSDAAIDMANNGLAGIAARFPNVALANVAWDKNTMICGDLIHPNDLGHAAIRDAVVVAARRLTYVA